MSVCVPCNKTELLPVCIDTINIGTITDFDTDIFIYVRDNTVPGGREIQKEETSGSAGEVSLDSKLFKFMPDHSYELWVTLRDATSKEDRETIDIGGTDITCLTIHFEYVKDESGVNITFTAQNIKLES